MWSVLWILSILAFGGGLIAANIFIITKNRSRRNKAFVVTGVSLILLFFSAYMYFASLGV